MLEGRALLAGTFWAGETIVINVTESADNDEVVTLSEAGASYVFTLADGVWSGTDGDGFSGAGTNTLVIDKAEASTHAGGLDLSSQTLVDVDTVDFSTLTNLLVGGEHILQSSDETVTVSRAVFTTRGTTTIEGTVVGTTQEVGLFGGRRLILDGAKVSTTSGKISLVGFGFGNWIGVTMIDTIVSTESGQVAVEAYGGHGSSSGTTLNHTGLYMYNSRIESTGVGSVGDISITSRGGSGALAVGFDAITSEIVSAAADIRVRGNERTASSSTGVRLRSSLIETQSGHIDVAGSSFGGGEGGDGLAVLAGSGIIATGTGTISLAGNTAGAANSGVRIGAVGPPAVSGIRSTNGAITIRGILGREGILFYSGEISSQGGAITMLADAMNFDSGYGRVVNSTGQVTLSTFTTVHTPILLGGTETSVGLHLSNEELDRVQAKMLQIGLLSHTAGVQIRGLINERPFDGFGTLAIVTAGNVSDEIIGTDGEPSTFGRLDVDRLALKAEAAVLQNASVGYVSANLMQGLHLENDHNLSIGNLSAASIFIDVTGTVTIAPKATLDTSKFEFTETIFYPDPPAKPQAQIPLLIQNDGSDPIVGTFAGLPEGTQIANVGGRPVRITYRADVPDGMNDALIALHVEPFAQDDAYTIPEDIGTLFENVLRNDIAYGNGPLTVTAVNGEAGATGKNLTLPSGATLWVDPDGYFYYSPGDAFADLGADEETTDVFSYEVTDAYGGTWTARVRITIVGEGTEDLIGFNSGGWYVAESDGDSFDTSAWAGWSDAEWDALQQGDFNGDGRTDVLGLLDGMWFVGVSTGSSFATSLWTQWANVNWQDVLVADLDRDGNDDILARIGGSWWGALSNGTTFEAPKLWTSWADLPWDHFSIGTAASSALFPGTPTLFGFIDGEWWAAQVKTTNDGFVLPAKWASLPNAEYDAIKLLDYDGDNGSDFAVLLDGTWTIGTQASYWGPFDDFQTVQWVDTEWQDIRIGDFDGDGRDDILARAGGAWWVMRFENDTFVTTRWDKWSNLDWQDITVADFDGDGTDDLAGRYAGAWWVGTSTGSSFYTTLWARWTEGGWDAVLTGDVNGVPAEVPSGSTHSGSPVRAGLPEILVPTEEQSEPEICEDYPYLNDDVAPIASIDDATDPEICEDFPYLDDDDVAAVAPSDETTEPEICLDYPFLDDDPLYDELLTTA